jgi:integrase/recombinase XerD
MLSEENTNLRTLQISIDSFLIDRKAIGLVKRSISFYALHLRQFASYCDKQSICEIKDITPDLLRQYILLLQETHNSGGVHASFRTLRTFFNWLTFEEIMPPEWKNPIKKIHAPHNVLPPLEPVSLDDINSLLEISNERDKCIFLFLLDSGVRASELTSLNIADIEFSIGACLVKHGKGNKQRVVFIGKRVKRALRAYLRTRHDDSPALFTTNDGYRLTYSGLHEILRRRMHDADLKAVTLHGFRRAFALGMLRGGADVFALQRLMGHSDLTVLRRYLAQNNDDSRMAHEKGSPVDSL